MKVLTEIDGASIDATELVALYDAFNPIVKGRIEKFGRLFPSYAEEAIELRDGLRHVTALVFAVQAKLGALAFQREQIGVIDHELHDLVDEVGLALGAGDEPAEEADQQIVMPA